jgi:phage shock protein A
MVMDAQTATLADALADVAKRRAKLEGEVGHLENQLNAMRGALREAANQESVLRSIIKGRASSAAPSLPLFEGEDEPENATAPTNDWANLSRTWVVLEAVAEVTKTKPYASPADVEELLASRNRTDDRDVIGAALSYLRKKGELVQLGRAQWGVPTKEVNP